MSLIKKDGKIAYSSAAVHPQFRQKIGSFTRDISLASGNQAVTGVGFKPNLLFFFASLAPGCSSIGTDNSITAKCQANDTPNNSGYDTHNPDASISITGILGGLNFYTGKINSLDTDGFTIAWTKTGAPAGIGGTTSATILYLALG